MSNESHPKWEPSECVGIAFLPCVWKREREMHARQQFTEQHNEWIIDLLKHGKRIIHLVFIFLVLRVECTYCNHDHIIEFNETNGKFRISNKNKQSNAYPIWIFSQLIRQRAHVPSSSTLSSLSLLIFPRNCLAGSLLDRFQVYIYILFFFSIFSVRLTTIQGGP